MDNNNNKDDDIDELWKREFEKMKNSSNQSKNKPNSNDKVSNNINVSIESNNNNNNNNKRDNTTNTNELSSNFRGINLNDPKIPPFIRQYLLDQLKSQAGGESEDIEDKSDGAHSKSEGPAPCGRRHWFRGKEVDYVANLKGHMIGWNKEENTITVAERFVEDNKLNEGLIDDTPLVNQISEILLKTVSHGHGKEKKKDEPQSTFDPYKPLIHGPKGGIVKQKDAKTGETKFISVVNPESFGTDYKGFDEKFLHQIEEKKKRIEEENEMKYQEYKRQQEKELQKKREIEERIKQNRQQREKEEEFVYEKKSSSSAKKIIKDGTVTYVEDDGTLPDLQESPKKSKTSNFANLSTLNDQEDEDDRPSGEDPFKKKKEKWTVGDVVEVIDKYGHKKAKEMMSENGFSEEDIMKALYFYLMSKQKDMERKMGKGSDDEEEDDEKPKKQSAFQGSGFSLKSSSTEPNLDEMPELAEPEEPFNFDEVPDLVVNSSSPTTKLRIRFNNGTTETVTFNLGHKVSDIRNYIIKKSQVAPNKFNMLVNNKVLDNEEETLEKAGLKSCVVNMTMK